MIKGKTNENIEWILVGVLAVLWGSSYLWMNLALRAYPPLTLTAVRVSIAAAVLMTFVVVRGYRLPSDNKTWLWLIAQAFLGVVIGFTLLAWGQQFVATSTAGVLNTAAPIFWFLFIWLWKDSQRTDWAGRLGALLGLVGVVLIIAPSLDSGQQQIVAAKVAILVSGVLTLVAAAIGRRLRSVPTVVSAAATMILAAIVLTPASLVAEGYSISSVGLSAFIGVLMLSLFSTAGAALLYFRLINRLGETGVASQGFLRIAVSVVLGVVALDELFTVDRVVAVCLIMLGVGLIHAPSRRRP